VPRGPHLIHKACQRRTCWEHTIRVSSDGKNVDSSPRRQHVPVRLHGVTQSTDYEVRFQVLTAASVKMAVFCVLAPCSLPGVYRRFSHACCLHHQGDTNYGAPSCAMACISCYFEFANYTKGTRATRNGRLFVAVWLLKTN
jgi:hypothetical protein